MYLCSSNALRVLHETWTGTLRRPVRWCPCNRLGHTMTQPAYRGTCAEDAAGHSECAKHRLTPPLITKLPRLLGAQQTCEME